MNQAAIKQLFAGDHVSYSRLYKYKMCPRAYRFRYMDRAPPETRASTLVFGSAIHEALAHFYEKLRDNQPEPTHDELSKVFSDYFQVELTKKPPVIFPEKEDAEILLTKGIDMLAVFHEQAERPYRVVAVESPFAVELTDDLTGVVTRFVGIFDCVVQDADGRYRILEHKTAAKRWTTEGRLKNDGQVTAYGYVAPQVGFGQADVTIQLLLKTKKPAFETYTPQRTDTDRAEFIETVTGVLRAVDAEAFYVCRDWHCKTCEFASRCSAE
jgi:putative RecB family exonuclease